MESSNEQEVDKTNFLVDSVEGRSQNSNLICETHLNLNDDSQVGLNGENSRETCNQSNDNRDMKQKDLLVVVKTVESDSTEINSEINKNPESTTDQRLLKITQDGGQIAESSTSKFEDTSFDAIEKKAEKDKSFQEEMLRPTEKTGEDYKNEAAEITQQNYENTLRSQNQDMNTESNTNAEINNRNNTSKQDNYGADTRDASKLVGENKQVHEDEESRKDLKRYKNDNENEYKDNRDETEYKYNRDEFTIDDGECKDHRNEFATSDDDSFHSISTNETNTKVSSPEKRIEDYVNENPSTILEIDEARDINEVNEDESQNSNIIIDVAKSGSDKGDVKTVREYEDSSLSRFEIDESSKQSSFEDEKDGMDNGIHQENNSNLHVFDSSSIDQENENTLSDGKFVINDKESKIESSALEPAKVAKLNGGHNLHISHKSESSELEIRKEIEDETNETRVVHGMEESTSDEVLVSERFEESYESRDDNMDVDIDHKHEATLSSHSMNVVSDRIKHDYDGEHSNCGSLASVPSNSTDTSSSHLLVIDHPMEESDAGLSVASVGVNTGVSLTQANDKPNKNALKLSLKRKLSNTSETGLSPHHKQAHIDTEVNENANYNSPFHSAQTESSPAQITLEQQAPEASRCSQGDKNVEQPFKSLLLQHLQKPYNPPPPPEKAVDFAAQSSLFSQKLERTNFDNIPSSLSTPIQNITENTSSPTRYLCFKCKTGSFDSFAALNEHQRECLADTRLLPERIDEVTSLLPLVVAPVLATPPSSASPEATVDVAASNATSQTPAPTFTAPSKEEKEIQKNVITSVPVAIHFTKIGIYFCTIRDTSNICNCAHPRSSKTNVRLQKQRKN
ncbi:unnamed protein product [Ceratitis capitata]|uniref:(Mediterranean fruit fly) hypothetical protein n=1 Tax=Ceratitis capitata TaxID=7213 RepID=A0A811VBE2_CERCA|nr:unnamed protein product [Ceratitis capitata]